MTFGVISKLIGTWRLVATRAVDGHGRPVRAPYGPVPRGIVTFGVDGRMMAVLCDGRPVLPPGETVREFNSYAGNFTFDGRQLVTEVDAASNPDWIGSEQVRSVRLEGQRLILVNRLRTLEWERLGST